MSGFTKIFREIGFYPKNASPAPVRSALRKLGAWQSSENCKRRLHVSSAGVQREHRVHPPLGHRVTANSIGTDLMNAQWVLLNDAHWAAVCVADELHSVESTQRRLHCRKENNLKRFLQTSLKFKIN